ncbi:hypothetical protein FRX31_022631, partial [Thalictrum thalictroides]
MSQPVQPSTSQLRATTTCQSQPTPPDNIYMRPGQKGPSVYYRLPDDRVPQKRTSSRLAWLLGVDQDGA